MLFVWFGCLELEEPAWGGKNVLHMFLEEDERSETNEGIRPFHLGLQKGWDITYSKVW